MSELESSASLKNGRNNRVFRLDLSDGKRDWVLFCASAKRFGHSLSPPPEAPPFPDGRRTILLKCYFQHPDDPRPRLQSEFSFLSYAWKQNIRCIPEPLACHALEHWALYAWLPGSTVLRENLNEGVIRQALHFLTALNAEKNAGLHLPYASEACLHVSDFYQSVERRLIKLAAAEDDAVRAFVLQELMPAWERIKHRSCPIASRELLREELCISPSDFGFHNALLQEGKCFFFDFEYAGWDDPAKMACDFFCQPNVPVPMNHFESVCRRIAQLTPHPESCLERIRFLLPVCQIKWCCIMLGRWEKMGKARRTFADHEEKEQLEKTREYLCRI